MSEWNKDRADAVAYMCIAFGVSVLIVALTVKTLMVKNIEAQQIESTK